MSDPRDWTSFDPNLRIVEHADETTYAAVVTHLPTGMQESCGRYPHMIENRAAAIAKLRRRIAGT